jgi:hypothetical protein
MHRIGELTDQWSFLWDKRRSLWIAAEDCPDGEQVEEPDLDVLLARLPATKMSEATATLVIENNYEDPYGSTYVNEHIF